MKILVWILIVSVVCGVDSLPQRLKIKITEENAPSAKSEVVSQDAKDDSLEFDSIQEGNQQQVFKNPFDFGSLLTNFNFYGDGASKTFNDATRVVETLSRLAIDQVKTIGTIALQSTDFINQSGKSLIPENDEDDDFLYDKSEKVVGVYGKKSINEPTPKKSGNIFESILGSGLKLFTDSLNLNRALPQQTYAKSQQTYDSDEVNSSNDRNSDNNEINNENNRNNDNNEINTENNRNNDNNEINTRNNQNNYNNEVNSRNNRNNANNEINTRNNRNNENKDINTTNNRNNDNNENNTRNNRNNDNKDINTTNNRNNDNNENNTRNNRNKDNIEINNERNRESSGRRNSDNGNERGRSVTRSSSISSVRSSRSRKKSTYDEDSDFLSDI